MATTTANRGRVPPASPHSHTPAGGPRGPNSTVRERPYSVREAALLLGVSQDAIEANYRDLEGFRIGRRILIPRHALDRLVSAPREAHDAHEAHDQDRQPAPPVERVLALLPLLARDERVKVAQAALAAAQPG